MTTLLGHNLCAWKTSALAFIFFISINGFAAPSPNITQQPQSGSVIAGSNATFTVIATGQDPLTYYWSFNGTNLINGGRISGANSAELIISNVVGSDAGNYQVIVSNRHDIATSSNAALTVLFPATITTHPTNRTALLSGNTVFSANGTGTGVLNYQWQKNGINLANGGRFSGATTPTLTISNIQMSDQGGYRLVLSNAYGTATSLEANLSVVPVIAWGDNNNGQITVPLTASDAIAVAAGGNRCLALRSNGTVVGWGNESTPPLGLSNVLAIAAGDYHNLALRNDGTVVGWGSNNYGETNVPAGLSNIVSISAGNYHSLALKRDGTVVGWGHNTYGQATAPANLTNAIAVAAGHEYSLAIRDNGTVVGWGNNSNGRATAPAALAAAVAVTAEWVHSIVLKSDGRVTSWGNNSFGQTNVPAGLSNVVAIAGGHVHGLALKNDGTMVGWGFNDWGQVNPPSGITNVIAIAGGEVHNVALVENPAIQLPPVISWQPSSCTVAKNETTIFNPYLTGSLPMKFQWLFNETPLAGQTNQWLALTSVQTNQAGNYQVVVTNNYGMITSDVATLTVTPLPPKIISQPANQYVLLSESAAFSVIATGDEPLDFRWFKDGVPISDDSRLTGTGSSALSIGNIQTNDFGSYWVVVSNAWGSATSSIATLSLATVRYVNVSNQTPVSPFTNWATAATVIQTAINVSGPGDRILVTNGIYQAGEVVGVGTYAPTRVYISKPISVISVNGPEVTKILGPAATGFTYSAYGRRCAYLTNGAMLAGFTLTGGRVDFSETNIEDRKGGGVMCASVSAIVSNCVITGNFSGRYGGGAYSGTLIDCVITDNQAINLFIGGVGDGGGAYASNLKNCIVTNNRASFQGGGACFGFLTNCLVSNNSAQWGGGASSATVANCTILKNGAFTNALIGAVGGGGVAGGNTLNSIVVENTGPLNLENYASSTLSHCCTFPAPGGIGNITNDPAFVDSIGGNYRLRFDSPCINMGNNSFVGSTTDLDGRPRIVNNVVDAGAYEYDSAPWFLFHPVSQTILAGTNIVLTVSVMGDPPLTYQWWFNGTPLTDGGRIAGANSSFLSIATSQTNDTGNYWAVVSNSVGTITSAVATVTVLAPPSFTLEPTNQILIAGSSASLITDASGTGPLAYQWYRGTTKLTNDTRLSGTASNVLSISNVLASDAGNYTVVVTNTAGSITSAIATITVIIPPAITIQPVGRSVPVGLPTTFSATASGTAPLSYQWLLNGTSIPDATNNNFTDFALETNDFGPYQLVVTNLGGAVTSSVSQLTIGPVAAWGRNSSLESLPPPGLSNVFAVAGGSGNSIAARTDGTLVTWGHAGGTVVPPGTSNVVALSSSDGTVVLRSDGRITGWNFGTVSVITVPPLTNIIAVAAGYNFGLALNYDGAVKMWGSGAITNLPPDLNKVAAIAAGTSHALALRDNGTVAAWGTGAGINVPLGLSNVVAIAGGFSHSLALKSDGRLVAWGSGVATNIPPGLSNIAAIAVGSYPQGQSHNLVIRSNGTVVAWGNNSFGEINLPTGLNNLISVSVAGAPYHSFAIVSDGKPLILRPPVGGTFYTGRDLLLRGEAVGAAPLSLQWSRNGTNIPGATSASLLVTNMQLAHAGDYRLTASNTLGVATSLPAPVTVLDGAPFIQSIPTERIIYYASLSIPTVVGGSLPMQFQWQSNGTNIAGATNNNLFLPGVNVSAGVYTLLVNNAFGNASSNVVVTKVSGPILSWGANTSPTNVPASASNAIAIAAGYGANSSDIALKADGTVVSWRYNGIINVPAGLSNVMEVAAGYSSSNGLALKTDGTVRGWGNINTNFLAPLTNVVSVQMNDGGSAYLRVDGSVTRLTFNGTTNIAGLSNIVLLAPHNYGLLALRADGTVYMDNEGFGPVPQSNNVIAMASGGYRAGHGLLLRRDGSLVSWGQPTNMPYIGPNCLGVAASYYANFAIRSDGSVGAWSWSQSIAPTNVPLGLVNVGVIDAGDQHAIALLVDRSFPSVYLHDALNTPALVVSSKGSSQWFGQTNVAHDGLHAAQNGPVGDGTASSMRMWIAGPVNVSFWWKVSSETNHDFLSFSAGGVVLTNISGETGWRQCTLTTPPGNQLLQWTYLKDASGRAGDDAAWVDQLIVTPVAPSILTQPFGTNILGGGNVNFTVAAIGTPPLIYSWRKDGNTIPGKTNTSLAFSQVTRTNSGIYSVVITNSAGSANSSNAVLHVHVPQILSSPTFQPDGSIVFNSADIGGGTLSPADLANLQAQSSSNLVDWAPLPGTLTLTNGLLQLQDPDSTNFPTRFYRILETW